MKRNVLFFIACSLTLQACKEDTLDAVTPTKSGSITETVHPGKWTRKADRPGFAGAYSGIQFSIDDKVYMGSGSHDRAHDPTFWEYDPKTNVWTQKANPIGSGYSEMVSFSIGKKGYSATGGQYPFSYVYSSDFSEYDPATNVWTPKAKYPGDSYTASAGGKLRGSGFSIGDKGYVGMGYEGTDFVPFPSTVWVRGDFYMYDPATDCWSIKRGFPEGGGAMLASFSLGNFGYMVTPSYRSLWAYDPKRNAWNRKASFPGQSRVYAVAFTIGSKAYVGTGDGRLYQPGATYLKDFYEYDPALDQWRQMADFAGGKTSGAFGIGTSTKGYVKTGYSPESPRIDHVDFWEFDPTK